MRIGNQPVSSDAIIAALTANPAAFPDGTVSAPGIAWASVPTRGFMNAGGSMYYVNGGMRKQRWFNGSITFSSDNGIAWSNTADADSTADLSLTRDAANILAQRNGASAQAFRVYNTFTDASNHERGEFVWSSNIFNVGTYAVGTGTNRTLRLNGSGTIIDLTTNDVQVRRDGTSSGTIFGVYSTGLTSTALLHSRFAPTINQASGTYTILDINPIETGIGAGPHYLIRAGVGGSGNLWGLRNNGAMDMAEIADPAAPSANRGLVYMRDNGSGKTQLVARFPTGAVVPIVTEP